MNFDIQALKKITVLYVEDEILVRTQTTQMLEKLFKKVFIASDGKEGLSIFKKNIEEIDVIVSDITMPEMTGFEMIELIHNIQPFVPVVLTTAHNSEEYFLKSIELKIKKYLKKPLKIKELTLAIFEVVNIYRKKEKRLNMTKALVVTTKQMKEDKEAIEFGAKVLKQQVDHLEHVVDNYVISLTIDKNSIIIDISNKFCKYFNILKEDLEGEPILSFMGTINSAIQKQMLEILKHKSATCAKYHLTFNSILYEVEVCIYPIFEEYNQVKGYKILIDKD